MKSETNISVGSCAKKQTAPRSHDDKRVEEQGERSRTSFLALFQVGLKILQIMLTLIHAALVARLYCMKFPNPQMPSYLLYINSSQLVAYIIEALLFLAVL